MKRVHALLLLGGVSQRFSSIMVLTVPCIIVVVEIVVADEQSEDDDR